MYAKSVANPKEIEHICAVLYRIAQRHTPSNCFEDVTELLNIAKILPANKLDLAPAVKFKAAVSDHSSAVLKQSAGYRRLRASFVAALSTIADLGARRTKRNKSDFHAGVSEGLRRAAKVAIMFLNDIDNSKAEQLTNEETAGRKTSATEPRGNFIR